MIYAIGDIHGCYEQLVSLHKKIMDHSKDHPGPHTVVCLGDYIDRGPNSKECIDFLKSNPFTNFEHVYIMGNHENMLLNIFDNTSFITIDFHLDNGGGKTCSSYGLDHKSYEWGISGIRNPTQFKNDYSEILNKCDHMEWYRNLKLYHIIGKYLFVHAGINPLKSLEAQLATDDPSVLYWIRDKFLIFRAPMEYYVIHGHTPVNFDPQNLNPINSYPIILSNRANADTGAGKGFAPLTALIIDINTDEISFLQSF